MGKYINRFLVKSDEMLGLPIGKVFLFRMKIKRETQIIVQELFYGGFLYKGGYGFCI
jgi:hypothetical protein